MHIVVIRISRIGSSRFRVQIRDGEQETTHRVTVPEEFLPELNIIDEELERVVEVSFQFLLGREPSTSILREFSLDEISRYFPEYRDELRRWLVPGRERSA